MRSSRSCDKNEEKYRHSKKQYNHLNSISPNKAIFTQDPKVSGLQSPNTPLAKIKPHDQANNLYLSIDMTIDSRAHSKHEQMETYNDNA